MTQKVLKVGSSAAVTLSKEYLETLGVKIGDRVSVQVDPETRTVQIRPVVVGAVDRDTLRWTKKFIERYRPALEALAKK